MAWAPTARTLTRTAIAAAALGVLLAPPAAGSTEGEPLGEFEQLRVVATSPDAIELVSWAAGRYRDAGIDLPPAVVVFHDDEEGCHGYLGYTNAGRVDLCVRLAMESGPQRIVLHELAHLWADASLDADTRERFLALRGLEAWADQDDDWKERGTEQAAEIVAWGLGDGSMRPIIEGDLDETVLDQAFRLLTGKEPR